MKIMLILTLHFYFFNKERNKMIKLIIEIK